jgi:hypothetical protein
MSLIRASVLIAVATLAGCATTIAPTYTTSNPDIMRIGGSKPENPAAVVENSGSFCVETSEQWNDHGKTPDGQSLWAKDTIRRVVPCQ